MKTFQAIYSHLTQTFVERQEIVMGMLVALIARQHMLLIGSPGTAKSDLVMEMARCINGTNYFQWLLSKYSTPEELFGPVSLQALQQDTYKRNTAGKMPEAHIAFLDEIFKSNSAILNSLLTAINERLFYNNGQPVQIPLMSVFGASNEYPEEDENLEALYDRFLLRFEVEPIKEDAAFTQMLTSERPQQRPQITLQELQQIQASAEVVQITQDIIDALVQLRRELISESIYPTDRRWKQSLKLIQAKAVLHNRNTVDISDLEILKDCLWSEPKERKTVASAVKKFCIDNVTTEIEQLLGEAQEIHKDAVAQKTTEAGMEANKKLKKILKHLDQLGQKHPNKTVLINQTTDKIKNYNKNVASECLGI